MRRRELIVVIAGAVALWPAVAAQPSERMRRVGWLIPFPETDPDTRAFVIAFTRGLARYGWVEGKNIRIDYRFAAGDLAHLKTFAAKLIALSPDAIIAATPQVVRALREETQEVPIVFVFVVDPVRQGLVESLARPGGNVTGLGDFDAPVAGKWLQLLKEVAPSVTRVAVLFNPVSGTSAPVYNPVIEVAAPKLGMTATFAPVRDDAGIEAAIAAVAREPGGGLISLPDSFMTAHRDALIAAAAHHRLPLMGAGDLWPKSGALISYWFDAVGHFAQAAAYIDRILRGAKPADLPVEEPTKLSLVINLKTAKALGLTVPPLLLAQADELIE